MIVNKISTPLSEDKFPHQNSSIENHSMSIGNLKLFEKYNIILALSILTFIVSLVFWIFVTFII